MMDVSLPACSNCALCSQNATMQCLICLKRGVRPAPTFCGAHCYREHWKSHRSQQDAGSAASNSSSSELSTKSSSSSSLSSSHSSGSPPPGSGAGNQSPSSVLSQSPTRPSTTSVHRRHRSHASHSFPARDAPCHNWGQHWPPAPTGSCHQPHPPHPWYDHGGWNPNAAPGMHHMHRGMPQEQMVGPAGNWGYPSRWGPPYYWGGNF